MALMIASAKARTSAKWPVSTIMAGSLSSWRCARAFVGFGSCRFGGRGPGGGHRIALLPDTLLLEGVRDFFWHVALVVLGQHAVGDEDAIGADHALDDRALPLRETDPAEDLCT